MNLIDQLNGILADLQGVWAESALMLGAIAVLVLGLARSGRAIKALFLIVLIFACYLNLTNGLRGDILSGSLFLSVHTSTFGILFLITASFLLLFKRGDKHSTEFYFFILSMLTGSLLMMKANSLLIIYLSIELVSFSSYILTNFSFKKKGFEASIKYLLFGAICSAIMLFGLGIIYGSTSTFLVSEWNSETFSALLPQVGFILLLVGIFFKISIAPAHLWVPATYQEAPADATAFMSIVPKLAALVLLKRIFEGQIFTSNHWIYSLVLGLGILTIVAGTLGAFRQSNARRMISFGAIAHSGFLLPLTLIQSTTASESLWYYSVVYAIMNMVTFYLLDVHERNGIVEIDDYKQTSRSVWIGAIFSLILVSLVGLPPLAGFTAKLFLFTTLWEGYSLLENSQMLWYLIVAVIATVGSLFFYLRIPRAIFLSQSTDNQSINLNLSTKILATLFCIVLLLLFFAPQLVMEAQQLLNNVHE
ncbi:NADH dehydrogenase subunit N [Ekhidna lutea]|uniref:NADH dehydrogenase subunit N n=1 Tax=Ekhidna lutea TaxID=447679 RepID=A0A239HLA6_EKHLU|nr:NADH-quinone oxidoreductase subunit N [Ekhidna lutea]SNS82169.1 NADH dehydrogenase subunit N [Ekhidna lutea]